MKPLSETEIIAAKVRAAFDGIGETELWLELVKVFDDGIVEYDRQIEGLSCIGTPDASAKLVNAAIRKNELKRVRSEIDARLERLCASKDRDANEVRKEISASEKGGDDAGSGKDTPAGGTPQKPVGGGRRAVPGHLNFQGNLGNGAPVLRRAMSILPPKS